MASKFEVGTVYSDDSLGFTYTVLKRTAKTVWFEFIEWPELPKHKQILQRRIKAHKGYETAANYDQGGIGSICSYLPVINPGKETESFLNGVELSDGMKQAVIVSTNLCNGWDGANTDANLIKAYTSNEFLKALFVEIGHDHYMWRLTSEGNDPSVLKLLKTRQWVNLHTAIVMAVKSKALNIPVRYNTFVNYSRLF